MNSKTNDIRSSLIHYLTARKRQLLHMANIVTRQCMMRQENPKDNWRIAQIGQELKILRGIQKACSIDDEELRVE